MTPISDLPANDSLSFYQKSVTAPKLKEGHLPFPHKLFHILNLERYQHIVQWIHGGKSFQIINKMKFMTEVVPQHFQRKHFSSPPLPFQTLINCYNREQMDFFSKTIEFIWIPSSIEYPSRNCLFSSLLSSKLSSIIGENDSNSY